MSSASSSDRVLGNTDEMMRSASSGDGAQASDASDEEEEDEIVACKRCERAWLAPKDWARDGLAASWPALREKLLSTSTPIAREDAAALTRARFAAEYEAKRRPCVVANRAAAREPLALAALLDEFGDLNWRVSDTHGQMVGLREWWAYAHATDDDAPFGIYDAEFGDEGNPTARLAAAYDVPAFAAEDAFARAAAGPRPPWRWILMGGPRSGTGMHVDPLHTHAWVHLCEGRKRWLMLPPDTTAAALATVGVAEGRQLPSGQFFARHGDAAANLPGAVEFVQEAGELVYVPAGWTHAVLNLDATVAVTHNYATLTPACVEATAKEEPEFFIRLLRGFPPGLSHALDAYRAATPKPLAVPDVAALVLSFCDTQRCVEAAATSRAFVARLDAVFWAARLRADFGEAAHAAAAVFSSSLAAWRRRYLDAQEADAMEEAEIYGGLC